MPAEKNSLFRQAVDCPRSLKAVSWGYIAAHIYGLAKLGSLDELLKLFSEPCITETPIADSDRKHIPNAKYDSVVIRDGPTFGTLMSNMDDTTLQFILQLSYTIKKIQAEALPSSQGSAGLAE